MAKKTTVPLSHFHRTQIGRAQRYMRLHFSKDLSLQQVAREAGSSSYHFGRLFMAYTGETTFSFLRRVRLSLALRLLQEDARCSVTDVALTVGYETPSAFNKVFKKVLALSPSEFRQLRQAEQDRLIDNLQRMPPHKEMEMKLTTQPEKVTRPVTHYVFVRKNGPFAEVAIPAWMELFPLLEGQVDRTLIKEHLGFSLMDGKGRDESAMVYDAGVALTQEPARVPKGLHYQKIPGGIYARFVLTGPYHQVWPAFEKVFQILGESKLKLRPGPCIENYVNDPNVTPEEELITEILVPVE